MFCRRDHEDLLLTSGPRAEVWRVPLRGFSFVSAIRWCGHRGELIATASPAGRRVPDVGANDRGDLRLFRCDPRDGAWERVHRGYAHDPVCLPAGGYVVHRGAGLTMLDQQGAVVREVKVGRFGWGPPSLSVSPDGHTVGWVRWRADSRRLRVERVEPGGSTLFRVSVSSYAWLDPHTIVYIHGGRPRLLDISSGETGTFGMGLRAQVRAGVPGATDLLRELADLPADRLWEVYGDVQVVGADVWLSASLTERRGPRGVGGLFRTDPAGRQLTQVAALPPGDRIEGFHAMPDRSVAIHVATYDGTTIVGRRSMAVGPMARFLTSGWSPLPGSRDPQFGFHRLPGPLPDGAARTRAGESSLRHHG